MQDQDSTNFEFILTLDGNIIIQRFFNVNGYNPKTRKSLDLYYTLSDVCDLIANDLKMKNLIYMTDNESIINDYIEDEEEIKEKNYLIELKLNNRVFIKRIFPAGIYHPEIRKNVDVRHLVKEILGNFSDTLSLETKNLEMEYSNDKL